MNVRIQTRVKPLLRPFAAIAGAGLLGLTLGGCALWSSNQAVSLEAEPTAEPSTAVTAPASTAHARPNAAPGPVPIERGEPVHDDPVEPAPPPPD